MNERLNGRRRVEMGYEESEVEERKENGRSKGGTARRGVTQRMGSEFKSETRGMRDGDKRRKKEEDRGVIKEEGMNYLAGMIDGMRSERKGRNGIWES